MSSIWMRTKSIDVEAFEPEELKAWLFSGRIQDAKTAAALSAYFLKCEEQK